MHNTSDGAARSTPVIAQSVIDIFTVWSAEGAWRLRGEALEPLTFPSKADAEREGRRLARRLAVLGRDSQVHVYDARNVLSRTIRYFAEDEPALASLASSRARRGGAAVEGVPPR